MLKIKNSPILILFEIISLKWIKSLKNFYWLETNLCQGYIWKRQPEFTYSTCGPFTKHCKRIQKFTETGNLKHLCRNDAGYSDSKNLAKRTISDKILIEIELI